MYIALFLFILIAYIKSLSTPRVEKFLFFVCLFGMWCLLAFRYGQGNDYFSYEYIYNRCEDWNIVLHNYNNAVHSEIGFRVLCYLLKGDYTRFIILISTLCMVLLYKAFRNNSKNPFLSLLLFYPTGYFTYCFNLLRQGIVITVFLGILIDMMRKKQWKGYIAISLILSLIHSSAVILLIFPLINYLNERSTVIIFFVLSVLGIIMMSSSGERILNSIPYFGAMMSPYFNTNINIFALLERTLSFLCVTFLYLYRREKLDSQSMHWIKIYFIGFGTYLLLMRFDLISSRIMILFKILEVLIIPCLLAEKSMFRQIIMLIVIIVSLFMLCKNMDSCVNSMNYKKEKMFDFLNYGYISIFNQEKYIELVK